MSVEDASGRQTPGPIDFVVIEFPGVPDTSAVATELSRVLDSGIVSLLDLAIVSKAADGSISRAEVADDALNGFSAFVGAQSGLFDDGDVAEVGSILEPGVTALLLAYENSWASGFVEAAISAGGQMVASDRIPAQVVLEAIDSLDSQDA